MRVVVTGGGTGGHIYPAISVGQAIRAEDTSAELLFVGSSHGPEGEIAREAGIDFRAVPSAPLTKSVNLKSAGALLKLVAGVFRAYKILKDFRPDVVIGTGGYTTAAVLIAARAIRCKIVIHEQNAVPGRTNLWLARIADRVCVTFDSSAAFFPKKKTLVTGMPVRKEFESLPDKSEARQKLGLAQDLFTICVVGGSQGAMKLNTTMLSAWPLFDDGATQVLHQVGKRNIEDFRAREIPNGDRYHIEPYLDMPSALASADLVISRSGASTISEITAAGIASILFPYPFAYANHQKKNAEYLVEHGASVLFEDETVQPRMLADIVIDLRSPAGKLGEMNAAAAALGKPDAARQVAEAARALVASCK